MTGSGESGLSNSTSSDTVCPVELSYYTRLGDLVFLFGSGRNRNSYRVTLVVVFRTQLQFPVNIVNHLHCGRMQALKLSI